ncbi:MAG: hypothetical protein G01um101470_940 [Parcubacteria group bacterium Gr01-1014_70]|nr:MAG: hypothetical protein G01um101470_940 [Parcubacteria group bacterium Gr01-1014_70]
MHNLLIVVLLGFIIPQVSFAAISAGVKPGSLFYFFDTSFEKIGLFFTFNPEKKAQKALKHAGERLAEIELVADDDNTNTIKTAVANYESSVALAAEKSMDITDKGESARLFTSIEGSASRNQEVLSSVLIKVPEEAKEAITQAIEVSKKMQEYAAKQISELKGEIEKLKQEVAELKKEADKQKTDEVAELKKQIDEMKKKENTIKPTLKEPISVVQQKPEQNKSEEKPRTVTLPNGAVVEMDANGNIIQTIKEAPQQVDITPVSISVSTTTHTIIPPIPLPIATPPSSTTSVSIPAPALQKQARSILQDDLDVYVVGTFQGQGGWTGYSKGENFIVVDTDAFSSPMAIYNDGKTDSVITKTGSLLLDGKQGVYVKTNNRTNWSIYADGNAQVRISRTPWASGARRSAFIAASFKSDGNVAYYDSVADRYKNFDTYDDNVWTLLEMEWRDSDKTARYRVNDGDWTEWHTFQDASTFTGFDNVGFDFVGGGGGVYFDSLK